MFCLIRIFIYIFIDIFNDTFLFTPLPQFILYFLFFFFFFPIPLAMIRSYDKNKINTWFCYVFFLVVFRLFFGSTSVVLFILESERGQDFSLMFIFFPNSFHCSFELAYLNLCIKNFK